MHQSQSAAAVGDILLQNLVVLISKHHLDAKFTALDIEGRKFRPSYDGNACSSRLPVRVVNRNLRATSFESGNVWASDAISHQSDIHNHLPLRIGVPPRW